VPTGVEVGNRICGVQPIVQPPVDRVQFGFLRIVVGHDADRVTLGGSPCAQLDCAPAGVDRVLWRQQIETLICSGVLNLAPRPSSQSPRLSRAATAESRTGVDSRRGDRDDRFDTHPNGGERRHRMVVTLIARPMQHRLRGHRRDELRRISHEDRATPNPGATRLSRRARGTTCKTVGFLAAWRQTTQGDGNRTRPSGVRLRSRFVRLASVEGEQRWITAHGADHGACPAIAGL
jgi:hypothetical protein